MTRFVTVAAKPLVVETPLLAEQRKGLVPSLTVPPARTIDSGLVTASGLAIHRRNPPIGFGREGER